LAFKGKAGGISCSPILCRRGQENIRLMKKTTFAAAVDFSGVEYVHQSIAEADKNHG